MSDAAQLRGETSPFASMSLGRRWMYALKLASWPKLLVPMLLGQAIGLLGVRGNVSVSGVAFSVVFTVLDLVFIVLLNDYFDRDVDALKRRMFPSGCSPKTIPDGILPARHLLVGGIAAGALAISAAVLTFHEQSLRLLLAAIACIAIFASYSLPPLRLNYRGGGELLEMVGVGFALPWLCAHAVSARAVFPELVCLAGFVPLCLASAIASGLSDEVSDRAGGKSTVVTRFGNAQARRAIEVLLSLGAAIWTLSALVASASVPPVAALSAAAVVLYFRLRLRRRGHRAVTNAFNEQALYKAELHRAIWYGATTFAALSMLQILASR